MKQRERNYDHFEHRHRFAVWAAARAAQRGLSGGTVKRFAAAINSAKAIRRFLLDNKSQKITAQEFHKNHRKWCLSITNHLHDNGVPDATFGRAAKLVAVYLKSMVVLLPAGATSMLARTIYPPIDGQLLKAIADSEDIKSIQKKAWKKKTWSTLNEAEYYELIVQLREALGDETPWWAIEKYWKGWKE
jgi:hypothetical protein